MSTGPQPLHQGATTVLDGAGAGMVTLGPDYGPSTWHVAQVTVRTSQPGVGLIPRCTIYAGTRDAHGLVDATYDGSQDSTDCALQISQGTHLIAEWVGGNPGDIATLTVIGTKEG